MPLVKILSSALTIDSGGSGGREGPIAQVGAGFGSLLAGWLGLPDRDRRVLLAAGMGAGVGSIFRSPLAGALFASEILYSDTEFESEVLLPATLSSIVAYCTFSLHFGFGSLFRCPPLRLALQRLADSDLAEIPVLDPSDPTKLVGMLSRRDLLRAYHQRRTALRG